MNIREEARKMKLDAPVLAASSNEMRNTALRAIAAELTARKEEIFAANAEDCKAAEENGIAPAVMKRLLFNEAKLSDVCKGIDQLISLPDPIGRSLLRRELDTDLVLERVSVPIGVIGVIFEARPDAMVQISTLCLKSGNCAILKGGKETAKTNRVLFSIIHDAAVSAGLPASCLLQAELHNEIDELLQCEKDVDLLIPRGSNQFVQYIMNNTKIPVMGHADGICHIYVDKDVDETMAINVIVDAKTQYTAACNAVETILVHRDIAPVFLPKLAMALNRAGVKLRGTQEAENLIARNSDTASLASIIDIMGEEDFRTEYLDLIISLKVVADVEEAIEHINRFGSHHTDSILTRDDAAAGRFLQMVDSAGVYRNCSTRFADGFRYGFGAEVGISTSKLHARGPVGLEGLVTYKYLLCGNGQIVGDYASGRSSFHFKDLD
ncbi:MAG: glutamate-5-semialdehyde dehydrogenase [Lachnospiraceae bacterium]|nr:glutamate-5-semialdehyde dehydrogenase [Lachnospiraceae bacterium]MDO4408659.1 glutamate-5-semialdehyde dehydrogenase [Eubacteriales bacterium]